MEFQFATEGERLVASPAGNLDADGAVRFTAAVQDQLGAAKSVTVDLDGLDHISLGGVRAFLQLGRALKGTERNLEFVRGGHAVRHALEQAGFDDLFAFTPPLHSHRGHHDETP